MDKMEQYKMIFMPQMRLMIQLAFEELANYKKQSQNWIKKNQNYDYVYWNNLYNNFFQIVFNGFVDCSDRNEIFEKIDSVFYNKEEGEIIYNFCIWFDKLTEQIGEEQSDTAYLEHPEWPKVYSGAKSVARLMYVNDREYNFNACLEEFNNTPFEEWKKKFEKNKLRKTHHFRLCWER